MNTITLDNYTYREIEDFAKVNHIDVADVVKVSIRNFLKKFQKTRAESRMQKIELPSHLEMLGGCLSEVADENDEKLNYLLEKYK